MEGQRLQVALGVERPERDALALFWLGWAVTLLPVWSHHLATAWTWGCPSGLCLALAGWANTRVFGRRGAAWPLAGCAVLICLTTLYDFWRLSPVVMLAQCGHPITEGWCACVLRHVETHWRWFPGTNFAMLAWISLRPSLLAPPKAIHALALQVLACGGRSCLMLLSMGVAMSGLDALAVGLGRNVGADGMVGAMVCGMALYHVTLELLRAGCPAAVLPGRPGELARSRR